MQWLTSYVQIVYPYRSSDDYDFTLTCNREQVLVSKISQSHLHVCVEAFID